jgi:hypothetical protein
MRIRVKTIRFIEFMAVGVVMGVVEDLIALYFATGETITLHVFWVVFLVALPFAFISEYIVDHPKFWKSIFRLKKGQEFEKDYTPQKPGGIPH